MRKTRWTGRFGAVFRGRPTGRGRGSSSGIDTRSSPTLTDRAACGISSATINASSMAVFCAVYSAPTACPTRSKLERLYGRRPRRCAVSSASRDVPCCSKWLIAAAVSGNQLPSTAPTRRAIGSTTFPFRVARYSDRATTTSPASV
jgi:hypothetical protein